LRGTALALVIEWDGRVGAATILTRNGDPLRLGFNPEKIRKRMLLIKGGFRKEFS